MENVEMLKAAYCAGQRSVLIILAEAHKKFPHVTTTEFLAASAQEIMTLWGKDGATDQ